MSEEGQKEEYTDEQITQVIRRLRVCQVAGLRLFGMVPKGKEDEETTKLENVMGISVRMTQMGAMPVITSIDFCALPIKTYRIRRLSGEYWAKELGEEEARIYATLYLDSIADLNRQKNKADDPSQIVQADPRAMALLNQLAGGGQMPPMGGPGGGIIPGR